MIENVGKGLALNISVPTITVADKAVVELTRWPSHLEPGEFEDVTMRVLSKDGERIPPPGSMTDDGHAVSLLRDLSPVVSLEYGSMIRDRYRTQVVMRSPTVAVIADVKSR